IRLRSVGFFLINCLDHILFWILRLIPRLRSDSWKLTAALLLSDPELLNKPFYLFTLCLAEFGFCLRPRYKEIKQERK
ncbi:hypothetical protein AMECASPLE_010929, partial [Ameca splendens]